MATVLDALIVTLGLRPERKGHEQAKKDFKETSAAAKKAGDDIEEELGKKSQDALRKTHDEVDRTYKNLEEHAKKAGEFLTEVKRTVVGLLAAFTAGKGLKEFIHDQVTSNAALGRFAFLNDTNVKSLSTWRGMIESLGGSGEAFLGTVQSLTDSFQEWSATGQSSVIPFFRALHVSFAGFDPGKMESFQNLFLKLAEATQGMDPARASFYLKGIGLDKDTINLILQGPDAIRNLIAEQEKLGFVTEADRKAAADMQKAWVQVGQASTSLGRNFLTVLGPALTVVGKGLTNFAVWLRQHGPFAKALFAGLGIAAAVLAGAIVVATASFLGITAPIAATVAAIVGFAALAGLLYDDWVTWNAGGKAAFSGFWNFVSNAWSQFTSIMGDPIKAVTQLFENLWITAKGVFDKIISGASGIKDSLPTWLGGRSKEVPKAPATKPPAPKTSLQQQAWDAAVASEKKYGIPADVTYAQFMLESGGGKHMPAGSNNPFGIKARAGQPFVTATTTEHLNGVDRKMDQNFAKFDNLSDAFDAHAKLLAQSPAYAGARATTDSKKFADALTGVYATDPEYGSKLKAIMSNMPYHLASAGGGGTRDMSNHSSETNIGQVVVNTQATDAKGIARDLKPAMQGNTFAQQANFGHV